MRTLSLSGAVQWHTGGPSQSLGTDLGGTGSNPVTARFAFSSCWFLFALLLPASPDEHVRTAPRLDHARQRRWKAREQGVRRGRWGAPSPLLPHGAEPDAETAPMRLSPPVSRRSGPGTRCEAPHPRPRRPRCSLSVAHSPQPAPAQPPLSPPSAKGGGASGLRRAGGTPVGCAWMQATPHPGGHTGGRRGGSAVPCRAVPRGASGKSQQRSGRGLPGALRARLAPPHTLATPRRGPQLGAPQWAAPGRTCGPGGSDAATPEGKQRGAAAAGPALQLPGHTLVVDIITRGGAMCVGLTRSSFLLRLEKHGKGRFCSKARHVACGSRGVWGSSLSHAAPVDRPDPAQSQSPLEAQALQGEQCLASCLRSP